MRTSRPERLQTFDYLGPYRYFLTFCTDRRRPVFVEDDRVELVLAHILRAAGNCGFVVLAYCFMPDHVHLLIEGRTEDADCRRFIARAKQFSGFHFKRRFGYALWQRYGFERTLRDRDATLSVARYIVENPLRAGLVQRVADYRYVGSAVYTLGEICDAVQMHDEWEWSG